LKAGSPWNPGGSRNTLHATLYGFTLERHGNADSYGHGGIARGVNSEIRFFPSLDTTLIVFSNQDNGAYDDLRKNAVRVIAGER